MTFAMGHISGLKACSYRVHRRGRVDTHGSLCLRNRCCGYSFGRTRLHTLETRDGLLRATCMETPHDRLDAALPSDVALGSDTLLTHQCTP